MYQEIECMYQESVCIKRVLIRITNKWGWPEPCPYTVYDRIFGDFPAKNTVRTPYIHGSGQPYQCTHHAC
jgi:hypothetical protein